MLAKHFTSMKTDVKEKIIRYPITSQSFRCVDIYHQGIETFTAITCCYQKEEETKELPIKAAKSPTGKKS